MISTLICSSCGYRSSDVIPLTDRPPRRYIKEVSDKDGLLVRVIRSSTSTVRIPEFGLRIDPGSANDGYITNIEGVLTRVMSIISQIIRDLSMHPEQFEDSSERMAKALSLKTTIETILDDESEEFTKFTVIIEDPNGNSALVSEIDDVSVEDLTQKEILDLLGGIYVDNDD